MSGHRFAIGLGQSWQAAPLLRQDEVRIRATGRAFTGHIAGRMPSSVTSAGGVHLAIATISEFRCSVVRCQRAGWLFAAQTNIFLLSRALTEAGLADARQVWAAQLADLQRSIQLPHQNETRSTVLAIAISDRRYKISGTIRTSGPGCIG